jgi:hypothetical protein
MANPAPKVANETYMKKSRTLLARIPSLSANREET